MPETETETETEGTYDYAYYEHDVSGLLEED